MAIRYLDFKTQIKPHKRKYLRAVEKVLDSGWYILGQEVRSFEQQFARFLDAKYCIGVANGLEALQISLLALNIGKGDQVITTPISAVASTLAILATGAKPVFVDTDNKGLINADLIEKAITKKTKAILPVHLYGAAADLEKIISLCKKHQLYLIEDAAQAHGSKFKNKSLGTFGDLGCFSFYPTKNLGAFGDGGAIVTQSLTLAEKCLKLRDYGQTAKYIHSLVGLNSRLDEIHAAILKVKLKYLTRENNYRHKIAKVYLENLKKIPQIEFTSPIKGSISNYHIFAILAKDRDRLQQFLLKAGIETLVHYPITIPNQPIFNNQFQGKFPISEQFVRKTLSLPCNGLITHKQTINISQKIKQFYQKDL